MSDDKLTARDRRIQREVCPGCHYDRYNHYGLQDGPHDAKVTTQKCWHVEGVPYDRSKRRYVCSLKRSRR